MKTAIVILAAGKGSRMKTDLPKVLHKIGGKPLIIHAMDSSSEIKTTQRIVVVASEAKEIKDTVLEKYPNAKIAIQDPVLGTGHAVEQVRHLISNSDEDILVLYADTPFVSGETIKRMQLERKNSDLVVLGFNNSNSGYYGRLVTKGKSLKKIVEHKDATPKEKSITLCNSGILLGSSKLIFSCLSKITKENKADEYYLTDCIEIAVTQGKKASFITCDQTETQGVNSKAELAIAEAFFQEKCRSQHMEQGVTLVAPETNFFSYDTTIAPGTIIEPNVVFGPNVKIEKDVIIKSFSYLEGTHILKNSIIGPFARLRGESKLGPNTRVGNFVEIKNSNILKDAKISHLSYFGDAEVGNGANIGAGSITCNYDGVSKHKTVIGPKAFIGSNTMLVAPIKVGKEAFTASGAVISKNVEDGAFAIARSKQENKPNMAKKLIKLLIKRSSKKELD